MSVGEMWLHSGFGRNENILKRKDGDYWLETEAAELCAANLLNWAQTKLQKDLHRQLLGRKVQTPSSQLREVLSSLSLVTPQKGPTSDLDQCSEPPQ